MKHTFENNTLTFIIYGRADTAKSMRLEPEIDALFKQHEPQNICFDLAEVDYIASAFLRICSKMSKQIDENHFSIVNTQPSIKKIFKIAGLEKILNVS